MDFDLNNQTTIIDTPYIFCIQYVQAIFQINNKSKQNIFEMSESHQSGSNVIGSVIKNPSGEQGKYIQWGVPQSNLNAGGSQVNYPRRYPVSRDYEDNINRNIANDYPEQANRYYIENSQVSAIETGFKKLKTNQIQILKQLKKEYEVLRNSSLDSRVFVNKRNTSESESNADSISQSDAQSSIRSKNRQNRHSRLDNKQLQLAVLEKKQLELMLNNSMKKIQELLHNEIELKKNILELKSKLESTKISESQYDAVLKKSRENQSVLQKNIEDLRKENETLKNKAKEFVITMGILEGNINVKDVQLKKKQQRIKILEEEIHLQRNKYTSLQLDLKKLKMEYEILEKSKNQQISLLLKNRQNIEELATTEKNAAIRKLKQELQIKEERYMILLNKFNKQNQAQTQIRASNIVQRQEQKQYNKNIQKLIQTLKEEKSQQNNESIHLIMNKLSQLQHKPDQQLLLQINNLRHQLDLVKHSHTSSQKDRNQTQENINQYQQRIRQLQKIIEEENIQKLYFMDDIKKLTKEFNNLKREKQELIRDERELKSIIDRLESQNRRYRNEIEMIKNVNVDLTESQHQNKSLMVKLQHMNLRQIEISNVREEFTKRIDEFKLREQAYEEQIRITKRQLHQQQFKVFKEHEENELRLKLLKIEHENQVSRLQQELQKVKKSYALEKNELINEKIQAEKKLLEKSKQLEANSQKVTLHLKEKDSSLQRIKSEQDLIIKREQQRYSSQINALIARIQNLSATNEHLIQQSHKYALIQQEILELKKHMRMNRKLTETVDHLWQVKETQYANINQILKLCQ